MVALVLPKLNDVRLDTEVSEQNMELGVVRCPCFCWLSKFIIGLNVYYFNYNPLLHILFYVLFVCVFVLLMDLSLLIDSDFPKDKFCALLFYV